MNEIRKMWNDAYRKRLKETSRSCIIQRSLILENEREKYYRQNRNIILERLKKI
jgi:hypothetical protein